MDEWNGPGEGWREVIGEEQAPIKCLADYTSDPYRYWVPEVPPVPPLPTEPYTVIRVTWRHKPGKRTLHLSSDQSVWFAVPGPLSEAVAAEELAGLITGFEVLAEPRAGNYLWTGPEVLDREETVRRETAKAVLHEVRMGLGTHGNVDPEDLFLIGKQFGVAE